MQEKKRLFMGGASRCGPIPSLLGSSFIASLGCNAFNRALGIATKRVSVRRIGMLHTACLVSWSNQR